jgi:hypothetical protein
VVIQVKELKKLQEDQIKLKKHEEDLENTKAEAISAMESSHREALEAVRQENARQLMKAKQKLEAAAQVLKRQLAKEKATVLELKEDQVKLKKLDKDREKTKAEEISMMESIHGAALEAAQQGQEALKSQLAEEKAVVQELKTKNEHLSVKEDKMKTMLKKSFDENSELKKKNEEATDAAQLDCEHKDCGTKVQCKDYAAHRATCEYREVLCPGALMVCGKKVAFRDIKQHVQTCPGIDYSDLVVGNQSVREEHLTNAQLGRGIIWDTDVLEYNSNYFFVKQRKDHSDTFMAEVVMLGTKADCDKYTVEIVIHNSTDKHSAFNHLAHPRPAGQDDWGDDCLAVPLSELLGACVRDEQEKEYTFCINVIIRCI